MKHNNITTSQRKHVCKIKVLCKTKVYFGLDSLKKSAILYFFYQHINNHQRLIWGKMCFYISEFYNNRCKTDWYIKNNNKNFCSSKLLKAPAYLQVTTCKCWEALWQMACCHSRLHLSMSAQTQMDAGLYSWMSVRRDDRNTGKHVGRSYAQGDAP